MTISSTTRKAGPYAGNGVTTSFPFGFKVFQASDLLVVVADSSGNETTLVLDSDYSVNLNSDQNASPGGTITYPRVGSSIPVLPALSTIAAVGNLPNTQPTDLTNLGGFYPSTITDALDRATIQIQQLAEAQSRALVLPVQFTGVSAELPLPQAGIGLGWDPTGTELINVDFAGEAGAAASAAAAAAAASAAQASTSATTSENAADTAITAAAALNASAAALATGIVTFNQFDMGFVTDVPATTTIDLGTVP